MPVANTELLNAALTGDINGDEYQVIEGELNAEGGPKLVHHFKSKKLYVRGLTKLKKTGGTVVPKEEAQAIIEKIRK
jgi:hypothetical protein